MYVTLNVTGSNNNLARTPEQDQEYIGRNDANLNWLNSTFDWAQAKNRIAVMVIWQADPWDPELKPGEDVGFKDTLETLAAPHDPVR